MRLRGLTTGTEGATGTTKRSLPQRGRRVAAQSVQQSFRVARRPVSPWRGPGGMQLRGLGGQVHGNEDLLDDGLGLDERAQAQGLAALGARDVDGEGSAQELGPGDVPGLAG